MLSRSDDSPASEGGSPFDGWGAGKNRRGTGRTDSIFTQGRNDPGVEAAVQEKLATLISRRGPELEALLLLRDPERSGSISVKTFSECLRAWVSSDSEHGGGGTGTRGGKREGPSQAAELTHADRKVLYRRWAVRGQVRYVDFLGASGCFNAPLPRYSEISTAVAAAPAAPAAPVVADKPARHPVTGKRASGRLPSGDKAGMHARNADAGEEETDLFARARVVLVHLSEVLRDEGEEAYFAAFEAQDYGNYRCLDEDGFVNAIETLAPEVTAEQVHDVFLVRSRIEGSDDKANYDELFKLGCAFPYPSPRPSITARKDLRKLAQIGGFQSGDAVELRVESRGGRVDWVPAQVVSRDGDGTFTVRFRSPTKVPGATGARMKESGVSESDMREVRENNGGDTHAESLSIRRITYDVEPYPGTCD
ncbi:unnamed protein product [Ectocarpus sp. CCAP 1310/34]|nr:unnamed protein product [Ectocarpus sp. CCAP 1310/34]